MDARLFRTAVVVSALLSLGANHRTQNFIVSAPTAELSREIGKAAERYRESLSAEWLGHQLPGWSQPCPITAHVADHMGAGGATSFMFERGQPFGWQMTIQGSRQRILDSVLPHEVTHTIFATHFGRPLPRWADEGACTTVEHGTEKSKQQKLLIRFLTTRRGIAFNHMFAMKEYPTDILPLYAQGYSLARYLIMHGGKRKFVDYVGDGMRMNNWTVATERHYGMKSLSELQVTWLDWVRRGSPLVEPSSDNVQIASSSVPQRRDSTDVGLVQAASERDTVNLSPVTRSVPADVDQRIEEAGNLTQQRTAAGSWYIRQSELARSKRTPGSSVENDAASGTVSTRDGVGRGDSGAVRPRSVTRPQPPQQFQQIILDRGPVSYPITSTTAPVIGAFPPPIPLGLPPQYDSRVLSGGTIWR